MFTAMDVFEHPELHDESIACNNFFRQLCKLMSASGVKDFSWRVGALVRVRVCMCVAPHLSSVCRQH